LTNAYLDGALERDEYDQRKKALLEERQELQVRLRLAQRGESQSLADLEKFVELIKRAYLQYENGFPAEKRDLLLEVMSNRSASGKKVAFSLKSPLSEISKRPQCPSGGPDRNKARTFWTKLLELRSAA